MLLVVDEVYRRLIYPPHRRTEPFHHYEHTVLCRSFSKDLGVAGERIGYLALHPSLTGAESEAGLALCQRALGYVNAPATAQLALLELPSWEANATPYRERRDIIANAAAAAGLQASECQGGLYLWVRSPWEDTMAFTAALAESLGPDSIIYSVDRDERALQAARGANLQLGPAAPADHPDWDAAQLKATNCPEADKYLRMPYRDGWTL